MRNQSQQIEIMVIINKSGVVDNATLIFCIYGTNNPINSS